MIMFRALISIAILSAALVFAGCSGEEGSSELPTSADYAKELEAAKNQDFSKMTEKRKAGEMDRIKRLEEMVKNPPKAVPVEEPKPEAEGGGGGGGRGSGGGGGGGMMQPPKDGEVVVLPKITHKVDGTPIDDPEKDKGKDKGKKKDK